MAFFDDRRTPDLQFDRILFATIGEPDAPHHGGRIHVLGRTLLHPGHAFTEIAERYADEFPPLKPKIDTRRVSGAEEIRDLRREHYNATITYFEHSNDDLWVLRIKPDASDVGHLPGQYTTLGLGYWEPRVDDADEQLTPERRRKMVRRSYSISNPVFDERQYLVDPSTQDEVEFYIVHVRPEGDRIPGLTPRLADKRTGDRIYLGPKITGRYTLAPVDDPFGDVVFLATGTGEAPHNAMVPELLRRGHAGQILSVVTVRYLQDLGYLDVHRRLEERFSNYRYVVLPTREPDHPKRYIQELITSGEMAGMLPGGLSPDRTHVFKLRGLYRVPLGRGHSLNLGAFLFIHSGEPWTRTEEIEILDGADTVIHFTEPRGSHRNPDLKQLSLNVEWQFPIVNDLNGAIKLDVINATDEQELVGTQGLPETGEPALNSQNYQRPRYFRLMARVTF